MTAQPGSIIATLEAGWARFQADELGIAGVLANAVMHVGHCNGKQLSQIATQHRDPAGEALYGGLDSSQKRLSQDDELPEAKRRCMPLPASGAP